MAIGIGDVTLGALFRKYIAQSWGNLYAGFTVGFGAASLLLSTASSDRRTMATVVLIVLTVGNLITFAVTLRQGFKGEDRCD